jgi:hypothetical protein
MAFVIKPIPSLTHPHLQLEIHYDPGPSAPDTAPFHITYNPRAHYTLGTEVATADEDEAIARQVHTGKAVGMPVWAYIHGSIMLRADASNPFACPWDSGRSGWVYATNAALRSFYNVKRLTKKLKEEALKLMANDVAEFSAYLNGDCYGFIIRDTVTRESLDSCWGYYGLEFVEAQGRSALAQMEAITPLQLELPLETATETKE